MTILAAPEYPNGQVAAQGNFTAVVTSGTKVVSDVPLTFSWLYGLWIGTLTLAQSYPTGFYKITVGGDDGFGNSGSFATIILVAPFNLQGRATIPNPTISISGGSEPSVTAKITYPNGTSDEDW